MTKGFKKKRATKGYKKNRITKLAKTNLSGSKTWSKKPSARL